MKFAFLLFFLLYPMGSQIIPQQKMSETFHPFSNALALTFEFGGTLPYMDFAFPDLDYFGRGSIEYFFSSRSIHSFGIKILGGRGLISAELESGGMDYPPPVKNFRTGIFFIGGGLVYGIKLGNGVPYVSATVIVVPLPAAVVVVIHVPASIQGESDFNAKSL